MTKQIAGPYSKPQASGLGKQQSELEKRKVGAIAGKQQRIP